MRPLRSALATALAGAALLACTALTGVDDLEVGADAASAITKAPTSASSSSASGGSTSSASSTTSSSGEDPVDAGDDDADGEIADAGTSTSSTTSSSSSSSSSGSSGTTPIPDSGPPVVDAGVDSGTPAITFTDSFDRADSTTPGNGWIAKTPHFGISGNQLLQTGSTDDGYYNIELFRPDQVLNVQVTADVTFPATDTAMTADPMLSVRVPESSVATYNTFDGYAFYVFRDGAAISRENANGGTEDDLDYQDLAPPLATGAVYHLMFKVTGTNPVALSASIVDAKGATVMTFTASDATAKRFSSAGRTAIGAGTEGIGLLWNNYVRTTL